MAKKFQVQGFVLGATNVAPVNLQVAGGRYMHIGVPPRTRKIHQPRRRLEVAGVPEVEQPVKIRQASQNLGSVVSETRPVQNPPA